jgi:hypothetical protein|tara:strand:- start:1301 stop:1621 length:321 start_codon:yes stop_codon:yes gene_type:complete
VTRTVSKSNHVSIYIAGNIHKIQDTCREFCFDEGFCVTVTPTEYIYTGGAESGAIIGLINYPRFPMKPAQIKGQAFKLGLAIMKACYQTSFTVETPDKTYWYSRRT